MSDWSQQLHTAIDGVEKGLAAAVGLSVGMRGEDFEEALGAFLEWQQTLGITEQFRSFGGPQPGLQYTEVAAWLQNSKRRGELVMHQLHTNLYENFGAQRIAKNLAIDAYGRLFSILGIAGRGGRRVCATTNYDPSLELVMESFGHSVLDGFPVQSHWRTSTLEPAGMVRESRVHSQVVPVLHLHGAVGWYRNPSGAIEYHPPDRPFNPTLGTPALLLPDPKKDPFQHAGVRDIWREFADALETSTHILVLGHSLNDRHLVDQLRRHTQNSRVAVTTLPPSLVGEQMYLDETDRLHDLLPAASIFPLNFQPTIEPSDVTTEFIDWAASDPVS